MDRADMHALIDAQTAAGWTSATTLHDYHFNEETQELTDAGRTQLVFILNRVPPQFRTVYVAQGSTPDAAQLRAAATEEFLRNTGVACIPTVVSIPDTFAGRPANEVDRLRMLEMQSLARQRIYLIGAQARSSGGTSMAPGGGGMGAMGAMGSGTGSTTTQGR